MCWNGRSSPLNFPKLISRKIWVIEKLWNFHTVLDNKGCCNNKRIKSFRKFRLRIGYQENYFCLLRRTQKMYIFYDTSSIFLIFKKFFACHVLKWWRSLNPVLVEKTLIAVNQKIIRKINEHATWYIFPSDKGVVQS